MCCLDPPCSALSIKHKSSAQHASAAQQQCVLLLCRVGKKRKGRGFGSSILSEPLAAFMGQEAAPRNEVKAIFSLTICNADLAQPPST